jgi:serine/threonine-protein kinase RsbW
MRGMAAPEPLPDSVERTAGPCIELRLPSIVGWERVAMEVAAAAARIAGLAPERVEDVKTAVAEATLNAMEHGNAFDARRTVLVELVPRNDGLEVHVQDEGHTVFRLPATTDPPGLVERLNGTSEPRGWGVFLICSLMDEVQVRPTRQGTRLCMIARRSV